MVHTMIALLQHHPECLRGALPGLVLASLMLGEVCRQVPGLAAAADAVLDDAGAEAEFNARHRISHGAMPAFDGALPTAENSPGTSYASRGRLLAVSVAVLGGVRLLVQATSAAAGALCVGPEVEEEEEGWMAAWLASGLFDGGL